MKDCSRLLSPAQIETFFERLAGPEGCNFREDARHEMVWTCAGGRDKSLAFAILRSMGLSQEALEDLSEWFESRGGFCDCEIIFNVQEGWLAKADPV